MAKKIEYLNARKPNTHNDGWSHSNAYNWGAYDEPDPDDINKLVQIRIDNKMETENVANGELWEVEVKWRWEQLAPGFDPPPEEQMNIRTALCYVEAIWLETIRQNVTGHTWVLNFFFERCLKAECDYALDPSPWDEITYNGKNVNLDMFKEIVHEAGIEYRIDAWLSGVPLEIVLAD